MQSTLHLPLGVYLDFAPLGLWVSALGSLRSGSVCPGHCSQPFLSHAGYVMFWTLPTPCYYWAEHGGMFSGPAVKAETKPEGETSV